MTNEELTHEAFLRALVHSAESPGALLQPDRLPPEMAEHVRHCPACGRLAEVLHLVAADSRASVQEPPEGYWEDFDTRLAARLPRQPRRQASTASTWLRLAAGLALATSLAWWATRQVATRIGEEVAAATGLIRQAAAEDPDSVLRAAASILPADTSAEVWEGWEVAETASEPAPDPSGALETGRADVDPLESAADALSDELSATLSDEEVEALVARLRQEMAS